MSHSALDSQSERLVQEAIDSFDCNQTVLAIAHRLSTIVKADMIIVLIDGCVVQHGTHSTLIGRGRPLQTALGGTIHAGASPLN